MAPGDLLQWLSLAQKTGTLSVTAGGIEKRIFFEKGRVISSASNDPRSYLGQFLVSHGFIDEVELKKAMEVQAQSKILLGKILVTINAISEEDLLRLLRLKAEEEIYEIFLWTEGEFQFKDNELPNMEMVRLHIDVTGIIMEGTRRIDEWERIRQLVPGKTLVPVMEKPADVSALNEAQKRIVQAINGHRSLEELTLESRSSHFVVAKMVFELIREGYVRLVEPPPPPKEDVFTVSSDEDEIAGLLTKAQTALRGGDFAKGLRILKAAQNLEPTNTKVTNALKGAEALIGAELSKGGIVPSKIPKMIKTFDQMGSMNFTPNEGFILSRINGLWDLGSIMKISPMREIDALLIFQRLLKDSIIELA